MRGAHGVWLLGMLSCKEGHGFHGWWQRHCCCGLCCWSAASCALPPVFSVNSTQVGQYELQCMLLGTTCRFQNVL
jgi:hypothetical protein